MTTITVTITKATTPGVLALGTTFGGTNVVVKDNSGAVLNGKILNGTETPPWTAVFTGTAGPNEAQATITDIDSKGATLGTPIVISETGTGGIPQTFPQSAGAAITVV